MTVRQSFLPLCALLLLPACAGEVAGEVPSLAKRPYELLPEQVEALATMSLEGAGDDGLRDGLAPPLPPATASAMNAAVADHQRANQAFTLELSATRSAIAAARGAPVGSEAWVVAQMALTRLDLARAPSMAALGALDSLYAQTVSALGVHNAGRIAFEREQMAEDVEEQNKIIAELGAQLRY